MYGGHIYIPYCREIHIHSTIFLLESLMKRGSKTTNLVSDYMKITCRCSTPITNSPNLCSVQKAVVILNYRWSHQLHSPIHAGRSEDAPAGKMQGRRRMCLTLCNSGGVISAGYRACIWNMAFLEACANLLVIVTDLVPWWWSKDPPPLLLSTAPDLARGPYLKLYS